MNVLLIGGGGREHALAYALRKSQGLETLFVAPGNPGTASIAANVVLDVDDHAAVTAFCRLMRVGLVVVGPEAPLVAGLADSLRRDGILVFGPSKAAAALEGSKGFTKDFCRDFSIPTAAYARFTDLAAAQAHIREQKTPIVVKADGLASGKGVVIAATVDEALAAAAALIAGGIVIEECLEGEEVSFFALCDGERALAFGSAQDHKRVGEGDTGANTGGMGAYSPAPILTPALERQVMDTIIAPTLAGMCARKTPFQGVLYAGLMLTAEGPKLIEYNVRFGDPECQVLMLRLRDDCLGLLLACAVGQLPETPVLFTPETALTVVLAAKNYPGVPEIGTEIRGIDRAGRGLDGIIFQAGTRLEGMRLLASGGRVLAVTAIGGSVREAQAKAYAAVDRIDWPGGFCRRDIGWRAIAREQNRSE